jgi:EAL domain-containing protein (putative c-di-GMP-specific phosphodiesterase class I)
VDLATGEIRGVEALARWESDGELLLPARFVPVAEESSLIIDLDVHMIRRACETARRLHDLGHRVPLHVNISGRIVSWHGFVRVVLQAVDAAGIEPHDLSLELTESAAVSGSSASVALLELRDAGVTLAMDDFGSAYSAVARLRTLPVTVLKIDRAMVLAATGELPPGERIGPASRTPEAGATILAGVMQMAGQLGLRTIVEGVESREVRDLVRGTSADMAQGYFFGRPAPFDDLVETLRQAGRSRSA